MNRKRLIISLFGVVCAFIIGFVLWANNGYKPMKEAVQAMNSNPNVHVVKEGDWIEFNPKTNVSKTGFIFYPGGKVKPEAYAPLAKEISLNGYKVIIAKMPLDLAVLGYNKATEIINAYAEIENWVIGGHSLGGAMAAHYIRNNPSNVSGLVLLASYPSDKDSLANIPIEVISIYGSNDGVAEFEKIKNSKKLLPENTEWIEIKGGNHSQFGWYGFQSEDEKADISREKQQNILLTSILELLEKLDKDNVEE